LNIEIYIEYIREERNLKIKILVLLMAVVLAIGLLAGCTEEEPDEPDEPDEPEPVMPTASFTYEPMDVNITPGMDITFTDTSILGDAINLTWSWDFGDGNTSTEQNPMHNYSMGGNYTVTLTVTDEYDETLTDMSEEVIIEVKAE
jgi:PKD repeat protein